ncbi:MAG: dihydropteroate synthase [Sinobacteraceae bacterium]|nr:dihydropteroate synthase [Nevskiaceae bacterium]
MRLQLKSRALDLSAPVVMGVLNVTPDSFSDGGRYRDPQTALARAREMVVEGAAIVDVGGESTRPGSEPVSEQEELDRVVPVIERIHRELDCIISIDTMKPAVMRAACAAGAELINDVMALRAPGAVSAARETGAAVCLMHMQGEPRTMQLNPQYRDVVAEVEAFLAERLAACVAAGIPRDRLTIDPGIGFGKTSEHNLRLFAHLERFAAQGVPLLVGFSRKSVFGALLKRELAARLPASLAAAALAVYKGASIVRAHDVAATVDAIRVAHEMRLRERDIP